MTDQELVELFWQRREEALTGLQDKYGGWCRSIAGRILGEERDVEECLGDCWLQLWNAIPPARPQHFRGYLGVVVRNRALLLRRRRGRQGDTVSLAALELAECLPSREGPEEQAEAAELGRAISAFLGELGEGPRTAFLRRYWYGQSVADIAAGMNCGEGKVKSSLFRTRKALRTYLEQEEVFL